ncbi:MAG: NADH-quinone oxidoreductase subunit L [Nitrospinota bacterium]
MELLWLVIFWPLLGAALNAFLGRKIGMRAVGIVGSAAVGLAFGAAAFTFLSLIRLPADERVFHQTLFTWIASGDFEVRFSLLLDPLSSVMALTVSGVALIIHIYSIGYMRGDPGYPRYFAYLNLFTFSMLLLVLADNFLLMFIGWEAVGLCSYLLIGFWYERKAAADAGKKAFIVNRIGDFGFALGLLMIFTTFGTLDYEGVFSQAPKVLALGGGTATAISLLLFVGATGKSAQIPLYTWLPDAMEGPTPVSALIHAATMVTAGVYMVARTHVLFTLAPVALLVVALVGAATAIYTATIALLQHDIKRVLAYSTISQLGYMFLAAGVGAFSAGIFHLMTHAFFKALLFMGAGSVMHGLSGELDLRRMGGLRRAMPITYWTFLIAALAIAGVFPFAGFFSKDEILFMALMRGNIGFWLVGAVAALLTALYMFRMVFRVFHGESNLSPEARAHLHESPPVMTVPLLILAVLSTVGGFVGIPIIKGWNVFNHFLEPVFKGARLAPVHASLELEGGLIVISLILALVGIFLAHRLYIRRPETTQRLAERFPLAYRVVANKYYVDEIYNFLFVNPVRRGAEALWRGFDVRVVDGGVNGAAEVVGWGAMRLRRLQTGYVKSYAISMLLGAVVILIYLTLRS